MRKRIPNPLLAIHNLARELNLRELLARSTSILATRAVPPGTTSRTAQARTPLELSGRRKTAFEHACVQLGE